MNLNDLMIFSEVVEKGSFTAAAEALNLPKSNISRKVSRLETELGVALLERTTRKLLLTEVGRLYYEHCLRIKEEVESAEQLIEHMTAKPRGRLKVCASVSVGQNLLAKHLSGFLAEYPEVLIDLQLTNRRVDLVGEGFDVVIRVGESPDSSLIAKYLGSRKLQLYAAPDYLKNCAQPLDTPEDLSLHKCLYMTAVNSQPCWSLQNNKPSVQVSLNPVFFCDDFNVLKQLAVDGLGISLLPQYMADDAVINKQLIPLFEGWSGSEVNLYALVPSRRGITLKVRAFIDYFVRTLS